MKSTDKLKYQQLINKYLKGTASDEEKERLYRWINESSSNEELFIYECDKWETNDVEEKEYALLLDQKWNNYKSLLIDAKLLSAPQPTGRGKKKNLVFLRYAAIFILLTGISSAIYWYFNTVSFNELHESVNEEVVSANENVLILPDGRKIILNSTESKLNFNKTGIEIQVDGDSVITQQSVKNNELNEKPNQLMVPNGRRAYLTLSDGTKVWLNAGSKLIFPSVFALKTREVYVEGEAFFDVTKDAKKPFIVKTNEIDIRVFGTSFNISAYPGEKLIETVLVTGKVQIEYNKRKLTKNEKTILAPSQYASFERDNHVIDVKDVDVNSYISWKEGWYQLDKLPLFSVATKLERYYNVKIIIDADSLKDVKITGKLELNDDIALVIENLAETAKFKYHIDNNTISIFQNETLK
ncbi:MAG: anti-sigma [Prolixibacteraceae bacterium]|nr:MAG: anti-sigma [Prolixibacteraceae bacterium]